MAAAHLRAGERADFLDVGLGEHLNLGGRNLGGFYGADFDGFQQCHHAIFAGGERVLGREP